ncbi:tetratricopeptide repeat protein [Arcticibacter sp. MXS-1]|uniref:tetratricopeptide repeat protein n=1 Tax=Arcticibacter sp. MXS-1 TaxID=3341726 RepID=UPI0035A99093
MRPHILLSIVLSLFCSRMAAQTTGDNNAEKLLDLMQTQRYKEASQLIETEYPKPLSDKLLLRLAYCYYMAGNLPEAEKHYTVLYEKDTANVSLLSSLANLQLKRGNYKAAMGYLSKSLKADSTNFSTWKQLGQIGQIVEDSLTARYLERANSLNREDPDVAYDLSTIYTTRRKYAEAGVVLANALQADSSNMMLLRAKAKLAYAMDEWQELIRVCASLAKLGDESVGLSSWLGEAYYQTKQYKKCIETFAVLEEKGLEKESALYFTAKSYKNLRDQNNAIRYFRKTIAASMSPNVGNYFTEIGDSQEKLQQSRNALKSYQKSLDYDESSFTYYLIANLYDQKIKDRTKAALYYRKFLKTATRTTPGNNAYVEYAKLRLGEISK